MTSVFTGYPAFAGTTAGVNKVTTCFHAPKTIEIVDLRIAGRVLHRAPGNEPATLPVCRPSLHETRRISRVRVDTPLPDSVNPAHVCTAGAVRPDIFTCRMSRAISSAGERTLHTGDVAGSIPASPTIPLNFLATSDCGVFRLRAVALNWRVPACRAPEATPPRVAQAEDRASPQGTVNFMRPTSHLFCRRQSEVA